MGSVIGSVVGAVASKAIGGGGKSEAKQAGANSKKSLKTANALNKEQIATAKENLQFAKDQYADWQSIYGPIEKNLGEYYKNLSADKITAMGLQNQQMEFQTAMASMERDMAQRGISGSGVEQGERNKATFQNAEARAKIRTNAPEVVAQAKQSFLTLGLSSRAAQLGNIGNAATGVNAAYNSGVGANAGVAQSFIGQQTQLSNTAITNENERAGAIAGSISSSIGFF
jgi:hypothetical protein